MTISLKNIGIPLMVLALAACAPAGPTDDDGASSSSAFSVASSAISSASADAMDITLYFGDEDIIAKSDCGAVDTVTRTIPATDDPMDAAMNELFAGTNEEEKAQGLTDSFMEASWSSENVGPLAEYYNGVTLEDGLALIDFDAPALAYLNGPACVQQSVKTPIVQTLFEFDGVQSVKFSIDGELFDEWDA